MFNISNMQNDSFLKDQIDDMQKQILQQENQVCYAQNDCIRQSPFFKKYQILFNQKNRQKLINMQKYLKNLSQHNIIFKKDSLVYKTFCWTKVFESFNGFIQSYQVQFSFFKLNITLFNNKNNIFKYDSRHVKHLSSGSFGDLYLFSNPAFFGQQKFVIKFIKRQNQSNQSLQSVLKQFSFLKIFSAFQAGISPKNLFGFDIIQNKQNYLFSMEQGIQLSQYLERYNQNLQNIAQQLNKIEQSLLRMHRFQIVHVDIKPENIVYSLTLDRLVFIDFGLSQEKFTKLGTYQKQSFKGSLTYCSQQMKKLFLSSQKNYVDMYYNDAVCWKKTKKQIMNFYEFSPLISNQTYLNFQSSFVNEEFFEHKDDFTMNNCDFILVKVINVISLLNFHTFREFVHSKKCYQKYIKDNFQELIFIFKEFGPSQEANLIFSYLLQLSQKFDPKQIVDKTKQIYNYLNRSQKSNLQGNKSQISSSSINHLPLFKNQNQKKQHIFNIFYCFVVQLLTRRTQIDLYKRYLLKYLQQITSNEDMKHIQQLSAFQIIKFGLNCLIQYFQTKIKESKVAKILSAELSQLKLVNNQFVSLSAPAPNCLHYVKQCLSHFLKFFQILLHVSIYLQSYFQCEFALKHICLNQQYFFQKVIECQSFYLLQKNQSGRYLTQRLQKQIITYFVKNLIMKFHLAMQNDDLKLMIDCFKLAHKLKMTLQNGKCQLNSTILLHLNTIIIQFQFKILPKNLAKQVKKDEKVLSFIQQSNKIIQKNSMQLIKITTNLKINLVPYYFKIDQIKKAFLLIEDFEKLVNISDMKQIYYFSYVKYLEIQNDRMSQTLNKFLIKQSYKCNSFLKYEFENAHVGLKNKNAGSTSQQITQNWENIVKNSNYNRNFIYKLGMLLRFFPKLVQIKYPIKPLLQDILKQIITNESYLNTIFQQIVQELNYLYKTILLKRIKLQIRCKFIIFLLTNFLFIQSQFIKKTFLQSEKWFLSQFNNELQEPIEWIQVKINFYRQYQMKNQKQQTIYYLISKFDKWSQHYYVTYLLVLCQQFKNGRPQIQKLKKLFKVLQKEQKLHILFRRQETYFYYIKILLETQIKLEKQYLQIQNGLNISQNSQYWYIISTIAQYVNQSSCNTYSKYLLKIFQCFVDLILLQFKQYSQRFFYQFLRFCIQRKDIKAKPEIIGLYFMFLLKIEQKTYKQYKKIIYIINSNLDLVQSPCRSYILSNFYLVLSKFYEQNNNKSKKSIYFEKLHYKKSIKECNLKKRISKTFIQQNIFYQLMNQKWKKNCENKT